MLLGIGQASVDGQSRSALRPAAILTVISGDVLLRTAGGDFASANDGALLYVGSTVRTAPDARAFITVSEGSTFELEPASDSTIEETTPGGGFSLPQLGHSLARSWHVVTRLTIADSRNELRTPAVTASVRGIASEVAADDGLTVPQTLLVTTEPRVATAVAVGAGLVLVSPDQTSAARASSASGPRARHSTPRDAATAFARAAVGRATSAGRHPYRVHQADREEQEARDLQD
jgi:hypothetical protein